MKKVFKVGIIIALTFIIIQVEKDFKNRDFFNVLKVDMSEVSPSLKKDLDMVKEELLGKNINNINLKKIEEKISNDIRIKKVEVSKQKLKEIYIEIKEKENSYYIQNSNKIYTADENGTIFGYLDEYPKKSLPILLIKSQSNQEEILGVANKLKELDIREEISQIYIENKNLIVIVLRDGVKIKTNSKIQKNKYVVTTHLYHELKKVKDIEYMDIRFKDIVIKEREGKQQLK